MKLCFSASREMCLRLVFSLMVAPGVVNADYDMTVIELPSATNPSVDAVRANTFPNAITESGIVGLNVYYPDPIDQVRSGVWTEKGGSRTIGTLGGQRSITNDINESGQMVGRSFTSDFQTHAFLWSPGQGMRDLGSLGSRSDAYAVNASGQVVGITNDAQGLSRPFSWTAEQGMIGLDLLGAKSGYAIDVDDNGRVIGQLKFGDQGEVRVFSWSTEEGMADLGRIAGEFPNIRSSNSSGQLVGSTRFADGEEYRAFLFSPDGSTVELGTLGGRSSTALTISDSGQVAGLSTDASETTRAFSWTAEGGMLDLGTLGGNTAVAYGVNNVGQIVGESTDSSGETRAFIWNAVDGMVDLNELIPSGGPLGLRLNSVRRINDNGWIVAEARSTFIRGEEALVLLSPDDSGGADEDADGIADADDICPGTRLGVMPTIGAMRNRFYASLNGTFVDGRDRVSNVSLVDTGGCSGQQIIVQANLGSSNERFGVWERHLIDWANSISAGGPDEDGDGVGDADDICANTVLGIEPTIGATKNRFYSTLDGSFVDGRGSVSRVRVTDTGGCSGQQIIMLADLSSSNERYGLWAQLLEDWAIFVNQ